MKFFRKKTRHPLLRIILLLIVIGVGGFFLFNNLKKVSAEWFDSNWFYRQAVTITTASSASDVSDLDTWFTMNTSVLISANKLQNNCQDLRFTNANGKILPYFIDSGCNTTTTKIWVRIDLVPKNSTTYILYAYYGNPSAGPASDSNKFNLYNGLVGYWNMNEGTGAGTGLADFSVNNSTATASLWGGGNTSTDSAHVAGKYGNAFSFDGGDDNAVTSGGVNANPNTSDITISTWINSNSYAAQGSYNRRVLMQNIDGNNVFMIVAGDSSSNNFVFVIRKNGSDYQYSTPAGLSTSTWYHLVGVWHLSTNTMEIYINGVSQSLANEGSAFSLATADNKLYLGQRSDNFGHFSGLLDETRIYNRALSVSEISQLYNSTSSILTAVSGQAKPTVSFSTEEKGPAPVIYFKFDEGQGTTAYDNSSNRNNGTLTNGPTWQTEDMCITGKCLKFDGTDDYVSVPRSANSPLNLTSNGTVEAWVKVNSLPANAAGIIDAGNASTDNSVYYGLTVFSTGAIKWNLSNGSSNQNISFSQAFSTSVWYHIAYTWNGSYVYAYVNGAVDASSRAQTITPVSTGTTFVIGSLTTGSYPFNGFIDDVKIYPYTRTAAQIQTDYNSGKGGVGGSAKSANLGNKTQDWMTKGLVGYWKMDEATGSGSILADSSGNGNNGTAVLWGGGNTSTDSAHVAGKFGNGFSFDGGDDYINAGTNSSLNITNAITLSGWIKPSDLTSYHDIICNNWQTSYLGYEVRTYYGRLEFRINPTSSSMSYVQSSSILTTNVWQHISVVYDGTNVSFYLNGVLTDTVAAGGRLYSSPGSNFRIGVYYSLTQQYFSGLMDEMRIYNRALSAKEVSDLYNWAPGPVGWWKMDDKVSGASQTIIDSSGYGNNGTTYSANGTGMNCKVIGRYGEGCLFDGVDDYVSAGIGASLDVPLGDFTLESWVKPLNSSSTQAIVGKTILNTSYSSWGLYQIGGYFDFQFHSASSGNALYIASNSQYTTGTWYHLAVKKSGTTFTLYINGVAQTDVKTCSDSPSTTAYNFVIGARTFDYSNSFSGSIDDVRVYNYARTQKQIAEDMNAGHPSVGSPVGSYAGYWKFDEGAGTSAKDQSVNANTGTITGATWTNDGKLGKALSITSNTSYVSVPYNVSLAPTSQISFGAWFKTTDNSQNMRIISKTEGGGYNLGFNDGTSNSLSVAINVGGSYYFIYYNTANISNNVWYYAMVTYDGETLRLYINGKEVASNTNPSGNIYYSTNNSLCIGNEAGPSTCYYAGGQGFLGVIDEVKIYPFALTADDIRTEYNQGKSIVMGSLSNTSGLTGGSIASNSASAEFCIPGDTTTCNSPVGQWKFDENVSGNNQTVNDTSGNGNTGTTKWGANASGMNCTVLGKYATGCKLDGVDDYVDLSTGNNLDFGINDRTYEVWFKLNESNYTTPRTIFSSGADAAGTGAGGIWAYVYNTSAIFINFSDGTATRINKSFNTNKSLFDGAWHHFAAVFDRSATLNIYIDGVISSSGGLDISAQQGSIDDNYVQRLGACAGTGTYPFPGFFDDAKIFNNARTPAQVAWDYNRGKPIGYWKFDECQGSIAKDLSGNGNDGTITIGATGAQTTLGTCAESNSAAAWYNGKTGKFNSALSFDGTDDYVDAGSFSVLNGLQAMSTSFWLKVTSASGGDGIIDKISNGYTFFVEYGAVGTNTIVFGTDGTSYGYTPSISLNQWYHVGVVFDGSQSTNATKLKIYLNGVLQKLSFSGTLPTSLPTSSSNLHMGGYTNFSNRYFPGLIDEVKIFNYALTSQQILTDYNQGSAVRFGPNAGRP